VKSTDIIPAQAGMTQKKRQCRAKEAGMACRNRHATERTTIMPVRLLLVVIVAFAVGTLAAIYMRPSGLPSATQSGRALIGGPFSLVNQHGERVTDEDFAGQYKLVYFGYTYCPDFCPMSLSSMTKALDLLEPEQAERVTPIFISVDPERDTVEHLRDYAELFHPRLVALTGTPEEVDVAARAYSVYYNKVESDDSAADYLVDHSVFTYLMGPDGEYLAHFGHDATPEEIAERLRQYVG
jgi:cytochrome oxidase Cu insertion factor (SCO1/SenC/PrrC family)